MKRLNSQGFMLVETLIVTTIVASFIVFMYQEVHSIINNYNKNINYNTANAIYAAGNVRKLIYNDGKLTTFSNQLATKNYLNITYSNFSNTQYSRALFNALDIKKVILAKNDINLLKTFTYTNDFDANIKSFIKALKQNGSTKAFLLIVQLNNGELSSITVGDDIKDTSVMITGPATLSATLNTKISYRTGLAAVNSSGVDVSHLITCIGDVDLTQIGNYQVQCFVNDPTYSSNIFVRTIEVRA